jgi:hypothetical protein
MNFVNLRRLTNGTHNSCIVQGIKMPSLAWVEGHFQTNRRLRRCPPIGPVVLHDLTFCILRSS